jgi:hypothetical protein
MASLNRSDLRGDIMDTSEYQWRRLFWSALTDINSESSSIRLGLAEDAVFERLLQLEGSTDSGDERTALEDTMQDLRMLRNNSFHFRE